MSRPWHMGRLLAFDTETTGIDVESDRIVTAAMIEVGGGQPVDATTLLINPGVEIPEGATAVHGITTEHAVRVGVSAPTGIEEVVKTLELAIRARVPIVGMNVRFDLTILDREARRHGYSAPPWDQARVVDVLVIDKWTDRYRRGSRKLAALCEHYGVKLDDAHEAGADALAAVRVSWVQATRGQVVHGRERNPHAERQWETARHDIDMLHGLQINAAAEQARSLREYFQRKGDHEAAESVSEHWPVEPWAGDAS